MELRAVLAALAGGLVLLAPSPAHAEVLAEGHVDYAVRLVDGDLHTFVKDGTRSGAPVWRDPATVVFGVRPGARTTIPAGARTAFLGRAGDPIWMIPQVQRAGILWAGWNTEELGAGSLEGPITWTLDAVAGPGDVTVFQTGAFGDPDILFRSSDGLPDAREIPLGIHAHGNWAFSREGDYRLTFTFHGRRPSGDVVADTADARGRCAVVRRRTDRDGDTGADGVPGRRRGARGRRPRRAGGAGSVRLQALAASFDRPPARAHVERARAPRSLKSGGRYRVAWLTPVRAGEDPHGPRRRSNAEGSPRSPPWGRTPPRPHHRERGRSKRLAQRRAPGPVGGLWTAPTRGSRASRHCPARPTEVSM